MPDPTDPARRRLLKAAAGIPVLQAASATAAAPLADRVRPGQPHWPAPALWQQLGDQLEGALQRVHSPWPACRADAVACADLFRRAKNPYFLGDDVALTQTLGWVDAWTSSPSVYAVAARNDRRRRRRGQLRAQNTVCAWSSRAAATATRARRTRPIRCWSGRAG